MRTVPRRHRRLLTWLRARPAAMSMALPEKGWRTLLLLLGFFSLAAQTVLFREHLIAGNGNELGIASFLAAWMLWIAVGAWAGRFLARWSARAFPWLLLLYPAALGVQLWLTWSLRSLATVAPTALFPLDALVLWTLPACAPVSLCTGFLFTLASHRLGEPDRIAKPTGGCLAAGEAPAAADAGRAVSVAYGLEAAGAVAAGILTTLGFLLGVPAVELLLGTVLLYELLAAVSLARMRVNAPAAAHAAAVLLLATGWSAGGGEVLEHARLQAMPVPRGLSVVESVDTPYQSVTVAGLGEVTALFSDGELLAAYPDQVTALEQVAPLYAMKPDARDVLVLGFGAENAVCELAKGPARDITVTGADRGLHETILDHLPSDLLSCLEDPKVHVEIADARRFLRRGGEGRKYDLILLNTAEPRTAQAARFYTAEFFALVRARLARRGVFTLSATVTENVLESATLAYARTVYATLAATFPHVAVTGGERMALFASDADGVVTADPAELAGRFAKVSVRLPGFPAEGFATLFEEDRIAARLQALEAGGPGWVSRDAAPAVFLLNLLALQESPEAQALVDAAARGGVTVFLVLLAALLGLSLVWRPRVPGPGRFLPGLTVFAAGFAGMGGQLVVVLGYQAGFGSVFAEFGLLNALFMLGLFLGSYFMGLSRGRGPGGVMPVFSLCAVLGLLWLLVSGGGGATAHLKLAYLAFPLGIGLFSGWCVALAAGELAEGGASSRVAAAWVESLDHLGAMAGAVLCGLVFVPLAGLGRAGLLAAGLAGVALLLRVSRAGRPRADSRHEPESQGRPAGLTPRLGGTSVVVLVAAAVWRVAVPGGEGSAGYSRPVAYAPGAAGTEHGGSPGAAGAEHGKQMSGAVGGRPGQWADSAPGYFGPVEVLVTLDREERIVALKLGRHREKPEYLGGIEQWFATFHGKQAWAVEYGNPDAADGVDALTGATVTGKAVVAAVRSAGLRAREQRLVSRASAGAAAGPAAGSGPVEAVPNATSEVVRRDGKRYGFQRNVDVERLKRLIDEGRLSGKEAKYYIPVPGTP